MVTDKNVTQLYFNWEFHLIELNQRPTECDYIQWRLIFSYWIRDQKKRINYIRFSLIIETWK
jgi:hypothetical protein